MNGRELIQKACDVLNNTNIFERDIIVKNIDTITGEQLTQAINKFLDDIETISEVHEHELPDIVIDVYNSIVDEEMSFDTIINKEEPIHINNIEYRRTHFN